MAPSQRERLNREIGRLEGLGFAITNSDQAVLLDHIIEELEILLKEDELCAL